MFQYNDVQIIKNAEFQTEGGNDGEDEEDDVEGVYAITSKVNAIKNVTSVKNTMNQVFTNLDIHLDNVIRGLQNSPGLYVQIDFAGLMMDEGQEAFKRHIRFIVKCIHDRELATIGYGGYADIICYYSDFGNPNCVSTRPTGMLASLSEMLWGTPNNPGSEQDKRITLCSPDFYSNSENDLSPELLSIHYSNFGHLYGMSLGFKNYPLDWITLDDSVHDPSHAPVDEEDENEDGKDEDGDLESNTKKRRLNGDSSSSSVAVAVAVGTDKVMIECVNEGGKLRAKVISAGFDRTKNCQFPRAKRVLGKKFLVDRSDLVDAGTFYRVSGDNAISAVE